MHSTRNQRVFFHLVTENPAKEHWLHKLKPKIIHVLTGYSLQQVFLLMFEPPVAPENCLQKFSFLHGEQKAPVMENCSIHNASIFKSVKLSKTACTMSYMPTLLSGSTMNYLKVKQNSNCLGTGEIIKVFSSIALVTWKGKKSAGQFNTEGLKIKIPNIAIPTAQPQYA